MGDGTLNLVLAIAWVAIQAIILYYLVPRFLITRAAQRELSSGDHHDYAYRVAVDRYRAQRYRLLAVAGYVAIGLISALNLGVLRLAVAPLLYLGELVLLRNARADALLVRDLAREMRKHPGAAEQDPPG